jgi:RNA recognition motif-containing protein
LGTISINSFVLKTTDLNIYVGNLNWEVTDEDLMDLFSPFGTVSFVKIVTDKFKGNRSKGFVFVEMPNDEEAKAAIDGLHQSDVHGRNIIVNESQPRGRTETRSFGGGGNVDNSRGGAFKRILIAVISNGLPAMAMEWVIN